MILSNMLFSKDFRPTYSCRALKCILFNAKLMRYTVYSTASILCCHD